MSLYIFQALDAVLDLAGVTAEFLAESNWCGVLEVRATDLEDVIELLRLSEQRLMQLVERWNQLMDYAVQRCEMNRGGNNVVARLALIDMIVRMDRLVAACAAEELDCPVGNHLVGVHVRRGAGTGLKNVHRELRIQFSIDHFLGCFLDGLGNVPGQETETGIGRGGKFLDEPQRPNKFSWKAQLTDRKVLDGTGGLRAVVGIRRHLHRAHRISFRSKFKLHRSILLLLPRLCHVLI